MNTWGTNLPKQFDLAKNLFNSSSKLIIFPADQPDLSVKLLNYMSNNYSVLAYIDSNEGFNGALNQKNSLPIKFFDMQINVRQGLAMLSFVTRRPIIALLSYYDQSYEPNWIVYPTINPRHFKDIHAYCKQAIQQLYVNLEQMLITHFSNGQGGIAYMSLLFWIINLHLCRT